MAFEIRAAQGTCDIEIVQELWNEYWATLGLAPQFQSFADELRNLPGAYGEAGGRLMIAWAGEEAAGTIALRRLSQVSCEVKRLYVRPKFRGQGLGRALLNSLIASSCSIGYVTMYADSLPSMDGAQALYQSCGFTQVGPYSPAPTDGAVYFELLLSQTAPAT